MYVCMCYADFLEIQISYRTTPVESEQWEFAVDVQQ